MIMLKKLITLANVLDKLALYDTAKIIDELINKTAEDDTSSFWNRVMIQYGLGANGQNKVSTVATTGTTILEALEKLVNRYRRDYNEDITINIPGGISTMADLLEQKARARYEKTGGDYHDGSFYLSFQWPGRSDTRPGASEGARFMTNCDLYVVPAAGRKAKASLELEMEKEVEVDEAEESEDGEEKIKKKKITLLFD